MISILKESLGILFCVYKLSVLWFCISEELSATINCTMPFPLFPFPRFARLFPLYDEKPETDLTSNSLAVTYYVDFMVSYDVIVPYIPQLPFALSSEVYNYISR